MFRHPRLPKSLQPLITVAGPKSGAEYLQPTNTDSCGLLRTRTISSGVCHFFFSVSMVVFLSLKFDGRWRMKDRRSSSILTFPHGFPWFDRLTTSAPKPKGKRGRRNTWDTQVTGVELQSLSMHWPDPGPASNAVLQSAKTASSGLFRTRTISSGVTHTFFSVSMVVFPSLKFDGNIHHPSFVSRTNSLTIAPVLSNFIA